MDAHKSKGLWLLPTKGHVKDRLLRALKSFKDTGISTPGVLIVDNDDLVANHEAYFSLDLPKGWRIVNSGEAKSAGPKMEWAYKTLCADADWIGFLADDLFAVTPEWDVRVIEALNGWNLISTDDAIAAPRRMNGATAWSGDLVREVGYLWPFKHWYMDDVWETIGRATGCWNVLMDVLVRHEHELMTGRIDFTADSGKNAFWAEDEKAYHAWTRSEAMAAIERVMHLMERKGVQLRKHDCTGVRIMLGVPSPDARYDRLFMNTYVSTRDAVRKFGGDLILCEQPETSDLVLARTKLFGAFRRSDCTHFWTLDSDQGCTAADLLKLLAHKHDFVAVAGIRKTEMTSFAAGSQDDFGRPMPIRINPENGLLDGITRVGMACCLITRECADRMAQHYSDLTFRTADGRDEVGVYFPLIVNRQAFMEDFAFCYRWRQIGGKITVDGTVSLDHAGRKVWSGAFLDYLISQEQMRQVAA